MGYVGKPIVLVKMLILREKMRKYTVFEIMGSEKCDKCDFNLSLRAPSCPTAPSLHHLPV